MQITLSKIYKAMIEQELPINFNNTINSLEYCKTEIEFKDNDYMEYKVGDKVKIREDLTKDKWYGDNFVVKHMMKYAGRIATIASGIGNHLGVQLDIDSGVCNWTYEMFDQNYKPESENYMKTSEFKKELRKMGYTFEGNLVNNENNLVITWISKEYVNKIETSYNYEISPKLFDLITKYAATPIAEREDEKLFNVQIIKGNWGCASWLYRFDDAVSTSHSADNNDDDQRWTLEQIKEYGIDDETVYKRVPVED